MRVNANSVLRSWTLLAAFGGSYAPDSAYILPETKVRGSLRLITPSPCGLGRYQPQTSDVRGRGSYIHKCLYTYYCIYHCIVTGYPITSEKIEAIMQEYNIMVTLTCDWKFIAQCFNLTEADIDDIEKTCTSENEIIAEIPKRWVQKRTDRFWWELIIILLRCSQQEEQISPMEQQIQHMVQYNRDSKLSCLV